MTTRTIAGVELDEGAELLVFACLLAQVDDVHSVVWGLEPRIADRADEVLAAYEVRTDAAGRAVAKSVAYLAADVDHIDLQPEEWEAAEALLAELSERWGR
jgi:hypothetical protein